MNGVVAEGHRHAWLCLVATADSWIHGGTKEDWADKYAALAGLTYKEARSCLTTLDWRAKKAAKGEKKTFQDRSVDWRLRFRAETMMDWLDVTAEDAVRANLRLLAPSGVKAAREVARSRANRIAAGGQSRDMQRTKRLEIGREALKLRSAKMTVKAIAERLGRSPRYIDTALREAKQAADKAIVVGPSKPSQDAA